MKFLVMVIALFATQFSYALTQNEKIERFAKYHTALMNTNHTFKPIVMGMYLSDNKAKEVNQYIKENKLTGKHKFNIAYSKGVVQVGSHKIEFGQLSKGLLKVDGKFVPLKNSSFKDLMLNLKKSEKSAMFNVFLDNAHADVGDVMDDMTLGLWYYSSQEYYERCLATQVDSSQGRNEEKCFDSLNPAYVLSKKLRNSDIGTPSEMINVLTCENDRVKSFSSTNFKVNCADEGNCSYIREDNTMIPKEKCDANFKLEKGYEDWTYDSEKTYFGCVGSKDPLSFNQIVHYASKCCSEYPENVTVSVGRDAKPRKENLCLANIMAIQNPKEINLERLKSLNQSKGSN